MGKAARRQDQLQADVILTEAIEHMETRRWRRVFLFGGSVSAIESERSGARLAIRIFSFACRGTLESAWTTKRGVIWSGP
jgi:hypothetical protein